MICSKAGVCELISDTPCAAKKEHTEDFFCKLKCSQNGKCIQVPEKGKD